MCWLAPCSPSTRGSTSRTTWPTALSRLQRLRDLAAGFAPWLRSNRRRLTVALLVGLVAGTAAALPQSQAFDRRGVDFLLPLRHLVYGPLFPPSKSDVVIVAIDEQTYQTEPFSNTPKVAWTPYLGAILDAVIAGGAKAVGFDMIFSTTFCATAPRRPTTS